MEKLSKIQQGHNIRIGCIPHRMFQRICKKLRETGSLTRRKFERRKRVCHDDNEINALATVNGHPQISLR